MREIATITQAYITLVPMIYLTAKSFDIYSGTYTKPSPKFIRLLIVIAILDWVALILPVLRIL